MITVTNVDKTFGDNHVLKDVSAVFEAGKTKVVARLDPSFRHTLRFSF